MKKLCIVTTTAIFILFSTVIMANNENSQISTNLLLFIQPKHEDVSEYLRALEVCECVAKKAQESWTREIFNSFEKDLQEHAEKTTKALKVMKETLSDKPSVEMDSLREAVSVGVPKQTESLNNALKNAIEFVESCEKEIGTEVEF